VVVVRQARLEPFDTGSPAHLLIETRRFVGRCDRLDS